MPKKNTHEEQVRVEDYYARRLAFLIQVWEGDRQHRIEFYKQLMILSVAGLGFNLSPPIRGDNGFGDIAWAASTIGFFIAIILTLILFYARASLYSTLSESENPDIESHDSVEKTVGTLRKVISRLTVAITLFFLFSVIGTIISIA